MINYLNSVFWIIFSFFLSSCTTSVCASDFTNYIGCNSQVQLPLPSGARFDKTKSIIMPMPSLEPSDKIELIALDFINWTLYNDLGKATSDRGKLIIQLSPIATPPSQVKLRFSINDFWSVQTDIFRLYIGPKFKDPIIYSYSNTYPINVEITKKVHDDNKMAIFVTEDSNSWRQLSRYYLSGSNILLDSGFDYIRGAIKGTLMMVSNQYYQDVVLEYAQMIGTASIPLPKGPSSPFNTEIPNKDFSIIWKIQSTPLTSKSLFFGLNKSKTSYQTCDVYMGNCGPVSIIENLGSISSRSLDDTFIPPQAKIFDLIAVDNQNHLFLIENDPNLIPKIDFSLSKTSTLAFQDIKNPIVKVLLADLDNDGLQDIIGASDLGEVYWIAQKDDGTFTEAELLFSIQDPVQDIAIGDLDEDELLDIAIITKDKLMVYRNTTLDKN